MPLASTFRRRRPEFGDDSRLASHVASTSARNVEGERASARARAGLALGRLELLHWLNDVLRADYATIEECADGVAYCQLLHAMHPSEVKLHRLDFDAKFVGARERNARTLRDAMRELRLNADVDFDGLARGKFNVRT